MATRSRPVGIFVYCTEEEKRRIERARRKARRTISGYVLDAVMRQVARDERRDATERR